MFSVREKREISNQVQKILRATNHPELPMMGEISFNLQVYGEKSWSFARIENNSRVPVPSINPHNERMDPSCS